MSLPLLSALLILTAVLARLPGRLALRRSARWPTVPGRVLGRELRTEGGGLFMQSYEQTVFEYEVDGRRYQALDRKPVRTTQFHGFTIPLGATGQGDEVEVAYDPTAPETTSLRPGLLAEDLRLDLLGLAIALALIVVA